MSTTPDIVVKISDLSDTRLGENRISFGDYQTGGVKSSLRIGDDRMSEILDNARKKYAIDTFGEGDILAHVFTSDDGRNVTRVEWVGCE